MSKAREVLGRIGIVERSRLTKPDKDGYVSVEVTLEDGRLAYPVMISDKLVPDSVKREIMKIIFRQFG